MKQLAALFLTLWFPLFAQMPPIEFNPDAQIGVQNTILAQVHGKTISMIDVKKKMDLTFYKSYPQLEASPTARYQFYEVNWRPTLMEMIDHQLILADADQREVKISEGDIREEMEQRFGPNILRTLDQIGLTYDETVQMIKEELIVQRMSWWFIHAKAVTDVTPHDIRQAFRLYAKEHPSYQQWTYRVLSIPAEEMETKGKQIEELLFFEKKSPEELKDKLAQISPSIQISEEFVRNDADLSRSHQEALALLQPGEYSSLIKQSHRAGKGNVGRIFYLSQKTDYPTPAFDELSSFLRSELIQKQVAKHSGMYLDRLRTQYGFDLPRLQQELPENLHPFSLQ